MHLHLSKQVLSAYEYLMSEPHHPSSHDEQTDRLLTN